VVVGVAVDVVGACVVVGVGVGVAVVVGGTVITAGVKSPVGALQQLLKETLFDTAVNGCEAYALQQVLGTFVALVKTSLHPPVPYITLYPFCATDHTVTPLLTACVGIVVLVISLLIPSCPRLFFPHDSNLPEDVLTYAATIPSLTDAIFSPPFNTSVNLGTTDTRPFL
jgi:hypothetical protein